MTKCEQTSDANPVADESAALKQADTKPKRSSNRLARRILLVLGTFLVGTAALIAFETAWLPPEAAADPSQPDHPSLREIPNFHKVESYLYRGAVPTAIGITWLKNHGVKTIIDVRDRPAEPILGEGTTARLMGFNYIHMPMTALPSDKQASDFLANVSEAANDPAKGIVFIHCAHGSDRTGYLVALWRTQYQGWRWSKAFAEMLRYGYLVHRFDGDAEVDRIMNDPANWGGTADAKRKVGQERGFQ